MYTHDTSACSGIIAIINEYACRACIIINYIVATWILDICTVHVCLWAWGERHEVQGRETIMHSVRYDLM